MKTKAHTIYKNSKGERLPSVTTIIGVLNKPALLEWAYQCGLRGEDYKKVRDTAADVGTLAHYMIQCHLRGEPPDTKDYSANNIELAENCLIKYWEWEKEHPQFKPVLIEEPLVSEVYNFGGTIDCLVSDGDNYHLIDHKSSKTIYPDMFIQLAAYEQLLLEKGHPVKTSRILRISKDGSVDFEEHIMADLSRQWQIFKACKEIYDLRKGE